MEIIATPNCFGSLLKILGLQTLNKANESFIDNCRFDDSDYSVVGRTGDLHEFVELGVIEPGDRTRLGVRHQC
jgi:hypothetical protein